jgi:hypothetical protein
MLTPLPYSRNFEVPPLSFWVAADASNALLVMVLAVGGVVAAGGPSRKRTLSDSSRRRPAETGCVWDQYKLSTVALTGPVLQ